MAYGYELEAFGNLVKALFATSANLETLQDSKVLFTNVSNSTPRNTTAHSAPHEALQRVPKLIDIQSILGSTSERRNTSFHMDSMISGIGSMTEHGIPLDELREEHSTRVSW